MDPTEEYCRITSSFDTKRVNTRYNTDDIMKTGYSNFSDFKSVVQLKKSDLSKQFGPVYCNKKLLDQVVSIRNTNFKRENFIKARNITNPFEKIGNSIFFDRAAVKLANVDALFFLTSQEYDEGELASQFGGLMAPQLLGEFYYCDVAGGPGGWTQYIQYRRPGSFGFGITLNDSNKWNTEVVNTDTFELVYGEDNTGNIYTNSDYFINKVIETTIDRKVDLVCADGGFSVTDNEEMQETLSTRLIFCECYIAASVVKSDRHFICKVFDTNTEFMADLIYMMSLLFETVFIFKPISSRPANGERYLVCRRLIEDSRQDVLKIMKELYTGYTDDQYYSSIFKELPKDFTDWITYHNDLNLERQMKYTQMIVSYLNREDVDIPIYNLYKALVLWNIPDSVDNRIDRKVQIRRYNQKGYIPRTSKNKFISSNDAGNYKISIGNDVKKLQRSDNSCLRV